LMDYLGQAIQLVEVQKNDLHLGVLGWGVSPAPGSSDNRSPGLNRCSPRLCRLIRYGF
jgi:hypothetical protein